MKHIRIKEAIQFALMSGKSVQPMDVAVKLWPKAKKETQALNISNLINGKKQFIKPEWVSEICSITGVDANFLFNIKEQ